MKISKSLSLREIADSTKRESAPPANEFGVKTRGGIIRTYFKPMAGRSYFDAQ